MYSFTSKLIGGIVMTHRVDMKELLSKLNTFDNQFSKIKKEILDKQNINFSTVNLISIIGDDRLTLKEITELSDLDKSTISRQINGLVKANLVTREIGEDKRFSFFELSDEAKKIYHEYNNDLISYFEDALKGWSEEEKQMLLVLVGRANHSMASAILKNNEL